MKYVRVLERILATIPICLGVAITVFFVMRFTPGDPIDVMMGREGHVSEQHIAALRREFRLDEPLGRQLMYFLGGLARGDLGNSLVRYQPVGRLIRERLPATIELALAASLVALALAIPVGVISAVRQNSPVDRVSMAVSFLGVSMPAFYLGIILILFFSVRLGWLPVTGRIAYGLEPTRITGYLVLDGFLTGNLAAVKNALRHLILPAITLGAPMAAIVARVTRSSMLEVLRQDFVTLARAKGLTECSVVFRHALRNALIPTVTVAGIQLGVLLGGNMIVETVFSWPGIGRLCVDAIFQRDYPVVQGVVMVYALTFVGANLVVDIMYTLINPKITL
ncbi:MAG: ABC transporter permease [Bacillota bacterium]